MLNKETYLTGITFLKTIYPNFNFDIKNTQMIEAWYSVLSKLSDEEFKVAINVYTETETYPPQSPAHLLNAYRTSVEKVISERYLEPNEAFETFRRYSFKYGGLYYHRDKVIKALKKDYPLVAETVEEFEHELALWQTSDTFLPKRFREYYQYLVDLEKSKHETLQIGSSDSKIKKLVDNTNKRLLE